MSEKEASAKLEENEENVDETTELEKEHDLPIEEVLKRIYGDNPPPDAEDEVANKTPSALKDLFENGGVDPEDDEEYEEFEEDEEFEDDDIEDEDFEDEEFEEKGKKRSLSNDGPEETKKSKNAE